MTGSSRGPILVIGGGISGITAAVEASEAGCEVLEAFRGSVDKGSLFKGQEAAP